MSFCREHRGRKAEKYVDGVGWLCKNCAEEVESEQAKIGNDIVPKACFVTYEGNKLGWKRIEGTGCAHWVAHQLNIKRGQPGEICAEGYTLRVPDVFAGARRIDRNTESVRVNDVWVNDQKSHCGLVLRIQEGEDGKKKITIRHCSSSQFGSGGRGVVDDDFDRHFKGKGDFYRW